MSTEDEYFEAALEQCDLHERVEMLYRRLASHVSLTHMGKVGPNDVDELLRWATGKANAMLTLVDRLRAAQSETAN